jgi:hypothetical protein
MFSSPRRQTCISVPSGWRYDIGVGRAGDAHVLALQNIKNAIVACLIPKAIVIMFFCEYE